MLTEQQCNLIEKALTEDVEPRKVAAYLCLHMGLMLGEVAALRVRDVDLDSCAITLRDTVTVGAVLTPLDETRTLPMPPRVVRYCENHLGIYEDEDCYLLTNEKTVPSFHHMQNILTTIAVRCKLGVTLSATDLRNAFIRRCIQNGMDLYSICAYVGIKQPNVIAKRFAEYLKPRFDGINMLERFSADYAPPEPEPEFTGPKRMNLLILGAGSQGPVVREIAEAIGIFDEIAFLDDDPDNKLAIGPLKDIEKLKNRFPMATASFGDGCLRERYMDALEELGYVVPSLIHPTATISPMAVIDRSVVIEARCIVSAGSKIGRGALLSSASVLEANSVIGPFVHVGSVSTISKGAVAEAYQRIPSGTVLRTH